MDKFMIILGVVSLVGLVTIGFVMKPIVTGLVLAGVALVGWHDDYYIPRKNRR